MDNRSLMAKLLSHAREEDEGGLPYIVFEGYDGVGKTTAMAAIAEQLKVLGVEPTLIHAPTRTASIGQLIRKNLVTPFLHPWVTPYLFIADHLELEASTSFDHQAVLLDRHCLISGPAYSHFWSDALYRDARVRFRTPDHIIWLKSTPMRIQEVLHQRGEAVPSTADIEKTSARSYEYAVRLAPTIIIDSTMAFDQVIANIIVTLEQVGLWPVGAKDPR